LDLQQIAGGNVLLVTVDTLRADALGCDGGPARTPAIDRLAADGLRFSFAHAHAVLTLPSHASILTGTYPFQHGIRDNSGYRLSRSDTLAARLKAAGYATGAFVGAFPLDARFGLNAGFDEYDGRFDDRSAGLRLAIPERPAGTVVGHATAWIRAQHRPWFAWVHVYEPHAPYTPPPPFDAEYAARPYFGEVAAVDRALAPLFDLVRQASRPTLVVLTGDHGEGLGEHGELTHGLFAYESTLRVPLLMAVEGGGAPSAGASRPAVADAPARHVDIVPTILDMLGLPVPAVLPGHSLRTDSDRQSSAERASYFEAMTGMLDYGGAPLDGVVSGHEKFIRVPIPELYDLARDRSEAHNLADTSAERLRVLASRLAAFAPSSPVAPRPEDPEVAARLRALGYTASSALRNARRDVADDPKRLADVDRALHDAVALAESGRLREAIPRFRDVLAARPALTAASRHLAFACWRTGDAAAAIAALEAARKSAPDDAGILVQLGSYLVEVGRAADAIALLERAAAMEPDVETWNALGLARARAGRGREALAAFSRALSFDPENGAALENMGAMHLDGGRLDLARTEFERAARSNPDSAAAHAGLAMTAVRAGDRATAIEEWKRAAALDPSNLEVLYDLGVQLARDNRVSEAKPYLERFARTAPPAAYAKELRNARAILALDGAPPHSTRP
jgi:arylsulfatase A-like enzyme/Tfp pilus assembly protein PilF